MLYTLSLVQKNLIFGSWIKNEIMWIKLANKLDPYNGGCLLHILVGANDVKRVA